MSANKKAFDMKYGAMKNAQDAARKTQASANGQGGEEDALPSMIEVMWNMTVIDITGTIREVVMKLCKDNAVSSAVQKKRAAAIRELGTIWETQKSKRADGDERKDARNMYMSATAAAMEAHLEKVRKEEESNAATSGN